MVWWRSGWERSRWGPKFRAFCFFSNFRGRLSLNCDGLRVFIIENVLTTRSEHLVKPGRPASRHRHTHHRNTQHTTNTEQHTTNTTTTQQPTHNQPINQSTNQATNQATNTIRFFKEFLSVVQGRFFSRGRKSFFF